MAINSNNYVDISTTFPSADVSGRSFGGLVFTAADMPNMVGTDGKPIPKKANGEPYPSTSEVGTGSITYYADNAKTQPWVWDSEAYEYYYNDSDGKKNIPDNANDIALLGAYNHGEVISLSLAQVDRLFGKVQVGGAYVNTPEADFASGYYGFISPTGRFASKLSYAKVLGTDTPLSAFKRVDALTNLFGSFTFLSVPSDDSDASDAESSAATTAAPTMDMLKEVAVYNQALETKYLFVVCDTSADTPQNIAKRCADYFQEISGTCYISAKSNVSAYMPMAIFASTDYSNGTVPNFMFKQFASETPTVFDDETYSIFNQDCVNFYGRTQSNGQTLDFYQRGFNTNGIDTGIYCNEIWFKSTCETNLLRMIASRDRLSADALGVDFVRLEVVDVCSQATINGAFMVKEPSTQDVRTIREIVMNSGGENTDVASIETDVSTKGYSVYAYLAEMTDPQKLGRGKEKIIVYYVFYGTADSIRFIKGNNILL